MPLQKQGINISFGQGLDTKSDTFQVQPGNFLELENAVFSKFKQLTKRNGFSTFSTLSDASAQVLTTFKDNLIALGSTIQALIPGSDSWATQGTFKPVELTTESIVKTSTNQSQADSAISPTGIVCTVYTDQTSDPSTVGGTKPVYKYTITDQTTGQTIVAPKTLVTGTTAFGAPKVYLLGYYFIIIYTNAGPPTNLYFVTIPYTNPTAAASSPVFIGQIVTPSQTEFSNTPAWDAQSYEGILYIVYNSTSSKINLQYISSSSPQTISSPANQINDQGQLFSISAHTKSTGVVFWVTYYNAVTGLIKSLYFTSPVLSASQTSTIYTGSAGTVQISNVASNAVGTSSSTNTVFYTVINAYAYDTATPPAQSRYINKRTVDDSGNLGTVETVIRSVGLASKTAYIDGVVYLLTAYQSPYQSSYFLINDSGKVVSKLAYSNGGGYVLSGALPNVTVDGEYLSIPYLFKSTITPVNKETNVSSTTQTAGIYSQLGINLATFDITANTIRSSEIGANLNLSGGYVSAYDGQQITEQGFFLYPDNVQSGSISLPTAGDLNSNQTITSLSSTANLTIGMGVTGSHLPSGTVITAILSSTSVAISTTPTSTGSVTNLAFSGTIAAADYWYVATYEWQDAQGNLFRSAPSQPIKVTVGSSGISKINVPTLRVTYKNSVKIVLYRWSVAQPIYYQVTSLTTPTLNSTTSDYVTIIDCLSDSKILGNSILYTTGGVLENISPPPSNLMTLFNNRLWLLDSENRNLLWFSKPVIESTPVEMSDLMTQYVAPSIASQGSTGIITAMSPMDDKLIIFKKNALGYISGQGPDSAGLYNQYSDFNLINTVVGCDQPQSIVFMPKGLIFQSNQGIWLLGRDLSTQYIGAPVEQFTQDAVVLSAINVPGTTQVRFTLDSGITLMYDYFFEQWGSFTNIPAISSTIYENLHTYLYTTTSNSQTVAKVSQETPGQYIDNSKPVLMKFKSAWMNFAGVQGFERFYQMYLLGKYLTPFKLSVDLSYDYNSTPRQSTVITPQEYGGTWGSLNLWGSGNTWGNTPDSNVFEARLFPQIQKCESFQITMTELYDSSFSTVPGAGLTLSGMNLVVGMKKGYRTSTAAKSFG